MKKTINEDNQLVVYKQSLVPIVEEAETLTIVNSDDMKRAVELLSELNKYQDKVIEWKEKKTVPLNKLLKDIRAETKPLETFYGAAIEKLRELMSQYQTELVRLQKVEQDKIAAKVSSGYLKIDTGVRKLSEVAIVDSNIPTERGDVQFAKVKRFEVMDMTLLPIEYHLANDAEIRKAMKEGKELAGVRYWVEQQPRNYR